MIGRESSWHQRIGKRNSNGSGTILTIKDGLVGKTKSFILIEI